MGHGLGLHPPLDLAALAVQSVKALGKSAGVGGVVAQQALDTHGHVVKATGGVKPRPQGEAEVRGNDPGGGAPGDVQQRLYPRAALPRADPCQALLDQGAVGAVERHDVRDGAQGDQIEKRREVGRCHAVGVEPVRGRQAAAQRGHDVEHHPDAGERLARERVAVAVGIHDGIRRRQRRPGQMVVGDDHANARVTRRGDTIEARYAVVDRNDDIRRALAGDLDDLRAQAVAVLEPIGDEVVDIRRAHRPEGA